MTSKEIKALTEINTVDYAKAIQNLTDILIDDDKFNMM